MRRRNRANTASARRKLVRRLLIERAAALYEVESGEI
jgi:hypothetical protein